LQEREVERLGSDKPIALDVRVLSATNINFEQAIKAHKFREDLYYRLNVFPLHLAPLRERLLDIIPIAERLIARHYAGTQVIPNLTDEAKERLISYHWQGNIRELDNVIQRAMVLQAGEWITAEDILLDARSLWQDTKESDAIIDEALDAGLNEPVVMQDLKEQEIKLILTTLKLQAGNRARTAEVLQMSPRTLRYKLAKLRDAGYEFD
jgi:two-component system response regulator FlrC